MMLIEKFSGKVSNSILPLELIRPYPAGGNRRKWEKIDESVKSLILTRAKKYMSIELKSLKATMILDAVKNRNMNECKKLFETKINALIALSLAECIDNNNKYTEKIFNIAWSLMDMSIWYLPECACTSICDATSPLLDEYSTLIGYVLTYTYYLLKEKFDKIDSNIRNRFKFEINRHITIPFLDSDDEYSPVCIKNIIMAYLFFEDNYKTRHEAIRKSMKAIDVFLNQLQNQDICNADTLYGIIECLEMLYMATDGVFDIYSGEINQKIIKNIKEKDSRIVTVLQYAERVENIELAEYSFYKTCGKNYMEMLNDDLPIDQSLYLIFNHKLIMNRFYMTEYDHKSVTEV